MFKKRAKQPVHINFKIPPVTEVVKALFGTPNAQDTASFRVYVADDDDE